MNRTTKINILAYASEPDKNFKYEGDIVVRHYEYLNYDAPVDAPQNLFGD